MRDDTFKAACNAIAELAFVSPREIIPNIATLLHEDLDPSQLADIGPAEAAIFRTVEGTAFVDVLSSKPRDDLPQKGNTKDYEVLKWEQELREQVAKKSGQQKKLSADDQVKVKAQLAKESDIRRRVRGIEIRLQRGIGIITSLATGPPTNAEAWIGPAIDHLMGVIRGGAGILVGDAAASAYLLCAQQASPRLGTLRQSIGVATLRAQGSSQLPHEMEQEELGS